MLTIIKPELQIKGTLKNVLTEQKASSIFYFLFVLVRLDLVRYSEARSLAWKNPCARLDLSSISSQC